MKQINPLYLLMGLSVALLVMLFSLNSIKGEIASAKNAIVVSAKLADNIVSLKKTWGSKKNSKKKIIKILSNSIVSNGGVDYKIGKSKVSISAPSIDQRTFNYMMNKILNNALRITSMKARRLDKTHLSLKMEISL